MDKGGSVGLASGRLRWTRKALGLHTAGVANLADLGVLPELRTERPWVALDWADLVGLA